MKNSESKEIISKNNNISSNENENMKYKTNQNNIENFSSNKDENSESNLKIFDSLNYIYIIKSFFCCKDEKTKLIGACHDYISKEICIENIFNKLNELYYKNNTISDDNSFEKLKKLILNKNE